MLHLPWVILFLWTFFKLPPSLKPNFYPHPVTFFCPPLPTNSGVPTYAHPSMHRSLRPRVVGVGGRKGRGTWGIQARVAIEVDMQ